MVVILAQGSAPNLLVVKASHLVNPNMQRVLVRWLVEVVR